MWGWVFWVTVALATVLGGGGQVSAELYLWTDEQGVVHMTNQWASVPESARAHVVVRESVPPSEGTPAMEPAPRSVEPRPVMEPPLQMPPDLAQTPATAAPSPSVVPYARESSVLIPSSRPFVQHPKQVSPPFPYNVRLDPHDSNFVWVGRNRVPKDTFTYPRVPLDTQAQFRNRVRTLEQRRSAPRRTFPTQPARP
jgi:hypothetical protein